MKNAAILSGSFNEWATPIITSAMEYKASQSQLGYFLGGLIKPEYLMNSLQKFIAVPMLQQYIEKVPDEIIPDFSLDLIEGMIQTRVKEGALSIPFLDWSLGADSFRALKDICDKNFKEYGENPAVGESTPKTEQTEVKI